MPKAQLPPATPEVKPFAITVRLDSEIAQAVWELSRSLRVSRTDAIRILINQGVSRVSTQGLAPFLSRPASAQSPAKASA
jgi:hypothetical protein